MRSAFIVSISVLLAAGVAGSCAPDATDDELRLMCERLRELRDGKTETDVRRCADDARAEGISRRQARCRISAVNATEYWVRCRTGEARNP